MRRVIVKIISILLLSLTCVSCSGNPEQTPVEASEQLTVKAESVDAVKPSDAVIEHEETEFKLIAPNTDTVMLCTSEAKQVYDRHMPIKDAKKVNPYQPLEFVYSSLQSDGILYLSTEADLSNSQVFQLDKNSTSLKIDNLMVSTEYFYSIHVGENSYAGSFTTEESTRFIYMQGAVNTRDIGGRMNLDGITVKQGLLIRGSEIDGICETEFFLRENALEDVKNTFGFVYDFDLRERNTFVGDYQSRLGSEVGHRFYESPAYGEIFQSHYTQSLRQIFKDLADPDKYPMYLHCTYGADRTGTIVFLLQAVLNMSEDDMYQEYLLSSYEYENFLDTTGLDVIVNGLAASPGETLQQKVVNYLTSKVGVKQAQIESIRSIFLEYPENN